MTEPAGTREQLAIIVVNFGSSDLLASNLAAGDAADAASHVVVVDNFSSTEESAAIRDLAGANGWELVANDTNRGFGTAVNNGVDRARALGCTAFLILNPDARITAAVASALFATVVSDHATLVAPRIVRTDGRAWFEGATLDVGRGFTSTAPGSDSSGADGWLTGACIVVHDDLWSRSGGFDDDYFLYWEDIDLSWRCRDAGGSLVVRSDLEVVHDVGGTQPESGKSPTYVYYNCRNRLLFAAKHLQDTTRRSWRSHDVAYAYRIITRGSGRRVLISRPRLILAAIRGTRDGNRRLRSV
ncbi:MAG: glycosyltransferase family 2 protein [Leifsonia sp.]